MNDERVLKFLADTKATIRRMVSFRPSGQGEADADNMRWAVSRAIDLIVEATLIAAEMNPDGQKPSPVVSEAPAVEPAKKTGRRKKS